MKIKDIPFHRCPCCKGTGIRDEKSLDNLRIYGMSLKEIAEIRDYAIEHGYDFNNKNKERTITFS